VGEYVCGASIIGAHFAHLPVRGVHRSVKFIRLVLIKQSAVLMKSTHRHSTAAWGAREKQPSAAVRAEREMELLGHNGSYHANPNVIVANCCASHYTIINTFASSLFLLIKSKYWISSVRAWLAACGCNLKLPATRFAAASIEINKTNGRCFFYFANRRSAVNRSFCLTRSRLFRLLFVSRHQQNPSTDDSGNDFKFETDERLGGTQIFPAILIS
jgi:hypothetical protein